MHRGDIISYTQITVEEGTLLQKGMNFYVKDKDYSVLLMSVRKDAPYADKIINKGDGIIYEGHDSNKQLAGSDIDPKLEDQPMYTKNGNLTENGKFFEAAENYKKLGTKTKVKVYEKIKEGIWSYNGFFNLVDARTEYTGKREVFKFKLDVIEELDDSNAKDEELENLVLEHNRLIPTEVKVLVYKRDKGRCVKCGSDVNLHYDHIIPFSKGGSSKTPDNIQLLCASCNLKKHDHIE